MIKFIEDSHRYVDSSGNDLISVSKFTEQFKEKVDWKGVAKRVAKKKTAEGTPMTDKEVLAKWEVKRYFSAEVGTLLHTMEEAQLLAAESLMCYDSDCSIYKHQSSGDYKTAFPINDLKNNTIYPELMIYDLENMICGQSDKVIIANDTINIWDYKTDKEISFKGYSSQWVKPKKYLPPISHLDECNGNTYSLKMSLYMYMLWKANEGRLKPGEIIIEHKHLLRDADNDDMPVLEAGKPVVTHTDRIVLPYRKAEVIAMLKTK